MPQCKHMHQLRSGRQLFCVLEAGHFEWHTYIDSQNPRPLSESDLYTRTQDVYRKQNGAHRVYAAVRQVIVFQLLRLWAWVELNYRPHAYQACALTT
jgi:hypothetical protein